MTLDDKVREVVRDILRKLDPENDEQWTADGLPRVGLFPEGTTREQITDAAPKFTRTSLDLSGKKEKREEEQGEEAGIEEELVEAQEELRKAEEEFHAAQRKVHQLERKVDVLIEARSKNGEPEHIRNMKEIKFYQDRQKRYRQERAAGFRALTRDLNPAELAQVTQGGKAPIDAAMRRRSGHGRERPKR